MRILLLAKHGQLGWELHRTLQPLGEVIALDYPEIDLTLPDSIRVTVQKSQPGLIINATAYTDVDRAESEPEIAMAVNGIAPEILAETARQLGAAIIHYSTDYVFDGTKDTLYIETDTPNPISVYGHSRIVTDQVSNPTAARILAKATSQLLLYCRIYHLSGDGYASRFDFTKTILQYDPLPEGHIFADIQSTSTDEFPLPARRPQFSALDCEKFKRTFNISLPPWQEALKLVMEENPRK